jgi:hypothetical protein
MVVMLARSRHAHWLRAARMYVSRGLKRPLLLGVPRAPRRVWNLSDGQRPTFFGYHDKTPFAEDGSKVLATSIEASDARADSECTAMRIGYFPHDPDSCEPVGEFVPFAETTTWCWQQGCMLQWDPSAASRWVLFNALVDGRYGAVRFDVVERRTVRTFARPIYSIHPAGTAALTVNFSRLGRLRPGYGYGLLPDDTAADGAPSSDGLFLMDVSTGRMELLVSLAALAADVSDPNAEHYVNHATFSPDGQSVVFFHVWKHAKGRTVRLCNLPLSSGAHRVIEEARMPSHYCWRDSQTILVTNRDAEGSWRYSTYTVHDAGRRDLPIAVGCDGHPMFRGLNDPKIVTDTYPDRRGDQHLLVADTSSGVVEHVASFFSPPRYRGQVRCDLHPRWDRQGRVLVVDSASHGRRQMTCLKV